MLTLHDYLPSQNGWKIRVLLRLTGTPYRTREVSLFEGESHTPAFLALNQAGAIPVLELQDGTAIAESNAILTYLAEGTPYLPKDAVARAKVMQWLFFEQYNVEPTIGSLRFWTLTNRLSERQALVASKREAAANALAILDRSLVSDSFLVGHAITIADIAIYAYSHVASDCGFDPAAHPAFAAWLARVQRSIGLGTPVHSYTIDRCSGA